MNIAVVFLLSCAVLATADQAAQDFLNGMSAKECRELLNDLRKENGNVLPPAMAHLKCKDEPQFNFASPLASLLQPNNGLSQLAFPNSDAGQDHMDALLNFMEGFRSMADQKKKEYQPPKVAVPGQKCYRESDCPLNYVCAEIEGGFMDILEMNNDLQNFPMIKKALDLDGKECSPDMGYFLKNNLTELIPQIYHEFYRIQSAMNKTVGQRGFEKFVKKLNFVFDFNFDDAITAPVTRQFAGSAAMDPTMLMLLLTVGRGNSGDSLMNILLLSTLSQGGVGGAGIMNNPILLSLILNPNGIGSGNSLLTIMLLSQSMGGGAGYGGAGPTQGFSLPLIFLLMQNQSSSNDPLSLFLPLLLSGEGDLSLTSVLLISGLLGNGGSAGGLNNILPLLLLSGGSGDIDPMIFLLISGGMGGGVMGNLSSNPMLFYLVLSGLGSGGQGFDPFTLLLLLGNNNGTADNDMLKILFMSDPRFASNPLSLLVLFGNNLFGGNATGGGFTSNPLMLYLLFMTGGDSGLTGGDMYTKPLPVTNYNTAIPPPGTAVSGPSIFGGTSSFYGSSQTGFGEGIFDLLLIMLLSGNGNIDFMTIYLLMFMMDPKQQTSDTYYDPMPVYYPDNPGYPAGYDPVVLGNPVSGNAVNPAGYDPAPGPSYPMP